MAWAEGAILVVDDNAHTNEALVRLLGLQGYRAYPAYDGQEALDLLRQGNRPAVIVLDLRMPILDGPSFREALVADPELARIPVIVYSVLDAPERLAGLPYARKMEPERVLELIARACPRPPAAAR